MKRIYLDYAATTPVDKEVFKEIKPYFSQKFGNAMSIHSFGQEALAAIDQARGQAAKFFRAASSEIIFTSGATEANNLAIKGVVKSYRSYYKSGKKPHIITTSFEHHCVLHACKSVEKEGLAEVTYVRPGKDGIIKTADIKRSIRPNTILVSVMYVNNEIGTVQPIAEIGRLVKEINSRRSDKKNRLTFHTDATQAINYFNCDVQKLGVDLMSMSAHKIYGPKGVGLLYIRKGTPIRQIKQGGDQEYKMRAGTHNVSGIVGLGKAIELVAKNAERETPRIKKLRDYLIKKVLKEISKSKLNGSKIKRSPNNVNFSFQNTEGEGLILSLDMEGVAASTGSACSSGALTPSHVLLSIGLKPEEAHGSLRMTLGKYTTKKEVDAAIAKLKNVIGRLRKISGHVLDDFYSKK
ncbi:MAG: cysteine desulfurase family protein [Patescibacteria group bacterium]